MPSHEPRRPLVTQPAIILAAGAGNRLGRLGRRYTKPMVPIAGRPLIDWVIRRLRSAGLARLIIVGHATDVGLRQFLATAHPRIEVTTQTERRGIADALCQAWPLIAGDDACLACACDSLFTRADIRHLIRIGQDHPDTAVIGVLDMGVDATGARSAVRLDGAGRVIEIVEKPVAGTLASGLVAVPLYWLPHAVHPYLSQVRPVGAERYISTALQDFVRSGGTVLAVRVHDRMEVTTAVDVARVASYLASR